MCDFDRPPSTTRPEDSRRRRRPRLANPRPSRSSGPFSDRGVDRVRRVRRDPRIDPSTPAFRFHRAATLSRRRRSARTRPRARRRRRRRAAERRETRHRRDDSNGGRAGSRRRRLTCRPGPHRLVPRILTRSYPRRRVVSSRPPRRRRRGIRPTRVVSSHPPRRRRRNRSTRTKVSDRPSAAARSAARPISARPASRPTSSTGTARLKSTAAAGCRIGVEDERREVETRWSRRENQSPSRGASRGPRWRIRRDARRRTGIVCTVTESSRVKKTRGRRRRRRGRRRTARCLRRSPVKLKTSGGADGRVSLPRRGGRSRAFQG